jgi:hypothetical protein
MQHGSVSNLSRWAVLEAMGDDLPWYDRIVDRRTAMTAHPCLVCPLLGPKRRPTMISLNIRRKRMREACF